MQRRPAHRPPRQERSRETLRRMLDAAEAVLEKHGLEGTTLSRIAAEAHLSPASVYRRFRDKDALMSAVFNRFSEHNAEELERKCDVEQIRRMGIRSFARQWIAAMIKGYRTRTGLIRAAVTYSQRHPDAAFVRRKEQLEIQSFRNMVHMFSPLAGRDPPPEPGVRRQLWHGDGGLSIAGADSVRSGTFVREARAGKRRSFEEGTSADVPAVPGYPGKIRRKEMNRCMSILSKK